MSKQLSDAQIREVITSLRSGHLKLTGSVVRSELRRRHGSPGGVSRVYRLLQEVQAAVVTVDGQGLAAENAQLKAQLAAAIKRAELAEQREDAHQLRWVMEIDSLRQQLRDAMVDRRRFTDLQNQNLELHRKLQATRDGG